MNEAGNSYEIEACATIVPGPCESVWWGVCEYDPNTNDCVPGTVTPAPPIKRGSLPDYRTNRLPSPSEVNLRIVSDIKALPKATDTGVRANDGVPQHDIMNAGIITNDGIRDDGVFQLSVGTEGDVWANDGIRDVAVRANIDRVNDDAVIEGRRIFGGESFTVEKDGVRFK